MIRFQMWVAKFVNDRIEVSRHRHGKSEPSVYAVDDSPDVNDERHLGAAEHVIDRLVWQDVGDPAATICGRDQQRAPDRKQPAGWAPWLWRVEEPAGKLSRCGWREPSPRELVDQSDSICRSRAEHSVTAGSSGVNVRAVRHDNSAVEVSAERFDRCACGSGDLLGAPAFR
jgi:hypothetical protein